MISIIQAKPQYLSDIYSLILQLATHENILDKISISESQLGELLFCEKPYHFISVALIEKYIVGLVMFNITYHNICVNGSTGIYIENLYVLPKYHNQGIGKELFSHVEKEAKTRNCSRIEWWVSRNNKSATNFYKKLGAIPLDEWGVFKYNLL